MKRATLAFTSLPSEIGPCYKVSFRCLAKLVSYLPLTICRTLIASFSLAFEMTADSDKRIDRVLAVIVMPIMGLSSLLALFAEAVYYGFKGRLVSVYYRDSDGNVQ
ncbi:hypothetical protein R2R70_02160 [Cobetia sp. SIMBA_158]|uniref:hypothetical protein n=1 Tax=Cobetia sp. SIMBA_158 TaxID=3081617 RepID=UPI00397EFD66